MIRSLGFPAHRMDSHTGLSPGNESNRFVLFGADILGKWFPNEVLHDGQLLGLAHVRVELELFVGLDQNSDKLVRCYVPQCMMQANTVFLQ